MTHTFSNSTLLATAALLAAAALSGCKARQLGVAFDDNQAKSVDKSWIAAARACWPNMNDDTFDNAQMQRFLADPGHVRAAFSTFSYLSDSDLRVFVTKPIQQAPAPDSSMLSHASTPVLTRAQAVAGVNAQNASTTDGAAPPDALCSIHNGNPVGFR